MECEYCKQVLKTAGVLKKHQTTATYCLAKQNKTALVEYSCSFCGTCFTLKSTLHSHLKICKANTPIVKDQLQVLDEKSNGEELFEVKIGTLGLKSKVSEDLTDLGPMKGISWVNLSLS